MQVQQQTRTGNLQAALSEFDAIENNDNSVVIENKNERTIEKDRTLTFGSIGDFTGKDRSLTFGSEFDFSFSNGDNLNTVLSSENNSSHVFPDNCNIMPVSVDSERKSSLSTASVISQSQNVEIKTSVDIHDIINSTASVPIVSTRNNYDIPQQNHKVIAHTPPSIFGTSYEAQHFGKRMRAGSVSGRLRSASDLEDMGVIDREQKSIIKDLIISGDKGLLHALDKYESGDRDELENLVKQGTLLQNKASGIDLLDDLDLDFLNFNEDPTSNNTNDSNNIGQDTKATFQTRSRRSSYIIVKNAIDGNGQEIPTGTYTDDGIGELDFNDDYSGVDYLDALANTGTSNNITTNSSRNVKSEPQSIKKNPTTNQSVGIGQPLSGNSSLSTLDAQQRCRSNTFSSLLGGTPPNESTTTEAFGRWIDGPVSMESLDGLTSKFLMESENLTTDLERNIMVTPDLEPLEESVIDNIQVPINDTINMNENKLKKTTKPKMKKEKKTKPEKKPYSKKDDKTCKRDEKNKTKNNKMSEPKPIIHGLGRPRSMSDPNLKSSTDADGLLHVDRPEGWVGAYSPESRKIRIDRFMKKRNHRVWTKKVKYDVRKNFADSRLRVKGRFVKKEDEVLMRDLLSLT